jgi:predicted ATPase
MGRLGQRWKEVLAGGLRLALLAGELGIGKTRLAAELAKAAHAEGAVVLVGRCDDALRGWLIGQVAAGGRKRLGDWLLGTEQERALQQAAISGCSSGGPARRRSRCCG